MKPGTVLIAALIAIVAAILVTRIATTPAHPAEPNPWRDLGGYGSCRVYMRALTTSTVFVAESPASFGGSGAVSCSITVR